MNNTDDEAHILTDRDGLKHIFFASNSVKNDKGEDCIFIPQKVIDKMPQEIIDAIT